MRLSDFAPDLTQAFRQGRTLACSDTEIEAPLEAHRASYRAIGVRAWAATPLVKANKLIAIVGVHSTTPRNWTDQDLRLLEDVADRTWAAVERARAESALRRSEQQQLLTLQLVPVLLWWTDPAGRQITANYRWKAYTGQSDAQVQDFGWLDAIHPDDLEATRAAFEHAFASGEPLERQHRIYNAREGNYRWHLVRHVPLRGNDDAVTRWFGAAIDVHELHQLQERQRVLVAELQHRTRNLLGVVRLTSEKTVRGSVDLADFQHRFNDRLDALARIQGLLSRLKDHDRITFDELLETELSAMDGGSERVTLSGPAGIRLRSSTVQILAMALHELATNAVKYGALGQSGARLDIAWWFEPAGQDDPPRLHIDWHEGGVTMPASSAPTRGGGHGRELIERALPYQLDAQTRYELGSDGVRCTMSIPVSTTG